MGLLSLIRLNRKSQLGRSDLGEVDCIRNKAAKQYGTLPIMATAVEVQKQMHKFEKQMINLKSFSLSSISVNLHQTLHDF